MKRIEVFPVAACGVCLLGALLGRDWFAAIGWLMAGTYALALYIEAGRK